MTAIVSTDPVRAPGAAIILGSCYQAKKDYIRSAQCFTNVLAMEGIADQVRQDAKFALARNFHLSGDFTSAAAQYQSYTTEYPLDSRGQLWYGICLQELRKWGKSVAPLEAALSLTPAEDADGRKEANYSLLLSYCQSGNIEKALPLYQSLQNGALKDSVYAQLAIGRCYQMNNKADEAKAAFEDLATNHPTREEAKEALLRVGDCLLLQKKSDEAVAYLDNLGKAHPTLAAGATVIKAEVLDMVRHDHQAALAALGQLVATLPPDDPVAGEASVVTARVLLLSSGGSLAARTQILQVMETGKSARMDGLRLWLGFCDCYDKNWSVARDEFQTLCDKYPTSLDYSSAKYYEGDCCVKLGDYPAARAALQEVIDDFPGDFWAKEAARSLAALDQ